MAPLNTKNWQGEPKTACFIFPEASGHIQSSLALTAHLTKKSGWTVHYLSAKVMEECIVDAGGTFEDERVAAPELCEGGLGYFAAYEKFRTDMLPEGNKAYEGRAHCENAFALRKIDGTIDWIRRKRPSVVVYCPIWNRVAQLASLALGIPHVGIVTIAGFGGFNKILKNFLSGDGVTVDDYRELYETSEMNQKAIDAFCSPPYNINREIFDSGTPLYYHDLNPPFGRTLGPAENLVTTIPRLRDKMRETIEEEDELYMSKCGAKLTYIGPMLGQPGQKKASTHKAAFTIEEQRLLIEQSEQSHRRRSDLHPKQEEDIVAIVKAAKECKRRVILVSLGTVVTSDRAGFGWRGTGSGVSITGKELVQSVINGCLDAIGLARQSPMQSIKVDMTQYPLIVCAVGQQPDALDSVDLPPNAICRASVPQVDILRCMDSYDLFVQHGGENSTMEGMAVGVPMVVCPCFADQPVNAQKIVDMRVGVKIDRPKQGGSEAVENYRKFVAEAICAIQAEEDKYAVAAASMKDEIAASGGEVEAEAVLIRAIDQGI